MQHRSKSGETGDKTLQTYPGWLRDYNVDGDSNNNDCLIMGIEGVDNISLAVIIIIGILLVFTSTLTVTIFPDILEVRFGPALLRFKFKLSDIVSCQRVKNKWSYGFGMRNTPHGQLYAASGLEAVEITLKDGKKYRIGTDAPWDLSKAIERAISK